MQDNDYNQNYCLGACQIFLGNALSESGLMTSEFLKFWIKPCFRLTRGLSPSYKIVSP